MAVSKNFSKANHYLLIAVIQSVGYYFKAIINFPFTGILKAVNAGQVYDYNRITKDVVAFYAGDFPELVEKLQLDLHEPPISQVSDKVMHFINTAIRSFLFLCIKLGSVKLIKSTIQEIC